MRTRLIIAAAFMAAVFSTVLWAASPAAGKTDSMLVDFSGQPHKLSDYTGKGKWLVVMIWASDCHVCNREVANYDNFHKKYKDMNAAMLGISVDGWGGKKAAMGFIDRHKVSFPSLLGTREYVTRLYGDLTGVFMRGTPAFLIFGPDGRLRAQQVGGVPVSLIENFIMSNSKKKQK